MRAVASLLVGLAAACGVGFLLFNFVLMPRIVQHGITVEVPAVTGLAVEEARRRCTLAGLQLAADEKLQYSTAVPAGNVLSQTPDAGAAVKRGRTVVVGVSAGQERAPVPDLAGKTLRQATLALENARLRLGDVATVPSGAGGSVVRASRPRGGADAALGDSVDVLVATGEAGEAYLMPSLVGQDIGDVRALVEQRGFRLGRVTYRSARGLYPGTVLEQYPLRGSLVRRGDAIDLVVATPD